MAAEWQPMRPARPVRPEVAALRLSADLTPEARDLASALIKEHWDRFEAGVQEWWVNCDYVAVLDKLPPDNLVYPGFWHLSIRRQDRQPITDGWQALQNIKNDICGPEREAVELYPAESRRVDAANQYHLWVLPVGRARLGFITGGTGTPAEAALYGAIQVEQRPVHRAERRRLDKRNA